MPAIVDRAVWEKVTKERAGIRWDRVVEKVWKDIGVNQEDVMSAGKFGRYKAEVEEMIERRETLALRNKVESKKKHLEIYGGQREGIIIKAYLHGPMDFAKTLKVRCRIGDLDLPERRKRYTSNREEEEIDAQMCPCGKAIQHRTHIAG